MLVATTIFGKIIIEELENLWYGRCLEYKGNNKSACIDNLVLEYDRNAPDKLKKFQGRGKKQLAYCAMTVMVVLDRAFRRAYKELIKYIPDLQTSRRPENPFRDDHTNLAYTKALLSKARELEIRIDKEPAPGSIFMIRSPGANDSSSGYHVGMVKYVINDGKTIVTVEGNTSPGYMPDPEDDLCVVKAPKNGILSKHRSTNRISYFIHVEEYFGDLIIALVDVMTADPGLSGETSCLLNIPVENDVPASPDEDPKIIAENQGVKDYAWLLLLGLGLTTGIVLYYGIKDDA